MVICRITIFNDFFLFFNKVDVLVYLMEELNLY